MFINPNQNLGSRRDIPIKELTRSWYPNAVPDNNLFIITRGKKGVFIYKKDKVNKLFPIIKIKPIIDTTGCGDIFICAFLYGLSKRYKIDDCVLFGNVCAGLSVKGFGLDSLPNKDDIIKKFNEVKNVNF